MKKIIIFLFVIFVIIPLFSINAAAETDATSIYKTAVAPVIDGELDDCYRLVSDSTFNFKLFTVKTKPGVKNDVEFYACWDNDFLYIFVRAVCNEPHVAYMDNATEHYIFNAHYMMTAICPDDPTKSVYTGTADDKGGWAWGALSSAKHMYEWTIIEDSRNGNNVISEHFNFINSKAGFEYDVRSADGFDCYEQKIPLKLLNTPQAPNGVKMAEGEVFGFGFAIGFTDVGIGYANEPDVVNFSDYFHEYKIVNALMVLSLESDLAPGEESSADETSDEVSDNSDELSAETSEVSVAAESDATVSQKTQASISSEDNGNGLGNWWIPIISAAVAIAGTVTVLIYRKRRNG